jgi:hypothetical protein
MFGGGNAVTQAKQLYGNTVFLPFGRKFASSRCTDCQAPGIPASCPCAGGRTCRKTFDMPVAAGIS